MATVRDIVLRAVRNEGTFVGQEAEAALRPQTRPRTINLDTGTEENSDAYLVRALRKYGYGATAAAHMVELLHTAPNAEAVALSNGRRRETALRWKGSSEGEATRWSGHDRGVKKYLVSFVGPSWWSVEKMTAPYRWRMIGTAESDDEAKKIAERDHVGAGAVPNGRRRNLYEEAVVDGMASTLWGSEWADHVEEHGCENLSGVEITNVMPDVPAEATEMARRYVRAIEKANKKTITELLNDAAYADGEAPDDDYAKHFGSDLGFMSMGAGVSWFDDHEKFPLKVPLQHDTYDLHILADTQCQSEGRPRAQCGHYCDPDDDKCRDCGESTDFGSAS